jgi:hypothetical protein
MIQVPVHARTVGDMIKKKKRISGVHLPDLSASPIKNLVYCSNAPFSRPSSVSASLVL